MLYKFFQEIVCQFRDTLNKEIGIINEEGSIIACSDLSKINSINNVTESPKFDSDKTFVESGYTYRNITLSSRTEYIVFIKGESEDEARVIAIISVALMNIKNMYDEKYDKSSFIKNVILDNTLPNDVYIKSKELHLDGETDRVVYLIKFFDKVDLVPVEIIQNFFPQKNKDYVISISENDIVLVKEFGTDYDPDEIKNIARQICDTVTADFLVKVMIGIGSVAGNIRDLSRSFKEAQIALEVGKVFDNEKKIIGFDNLGIGRLIYQLPTTLCEIFLHEVFKKGTLESLDRESLMTIQSFFENNLNVSETSRKLFVHRNTLVYRLEKIKKLTGLDLREFEHAITFKVALMVKKYLQSRPVKY